MGCTVDKNHHGNLRFRLYHQGKEWAEAIRPPLKDTVENRRKAEERSRIIDAEIRGGVFDYIRWFRHGNRAAEFRRTKALVDIDLDITVEKYFEIWINQLAPSRLGKNALGSYRSHLNKWVLPTLGSLPCHSLNGAHVRQLQTTMKQCRCTPTLINRTLHHALRALVRDMRGQGLLDNNIFDGDFLKKLKEDPDQEPDTYTAEERSRILSWFLETYQHYYDFVYMRFWTGIRPGEATALRLRDLDLDNKVAFIRRSRSKGDEGGTKTKRRRVVRLLPQVVNILRKYISSDTDPQSYVFKTKGHLNREGKIIGCHPINQSNFQKRIWRRCLKALNIRQRPFYNTRHTYISTLLSLDKHIGFVAKQVGCSATVIEKHYWKWIAKKDDLTLPSGVVDSPRTKRSEGKTRHPSRYPFASSSPPKILKHAKVKENRKVKSGGRSRTRTCDLLHVRQAL